MSDLPEPAVPIDAERSIVVGIEAFLPDGVTLSDEETADDETPDSGGRSEAAEVGMLDTLEDDLAGVEAALESIDAGSYGLCGACGEAIEDELLAVAPTRTSCRTHGV